MRMPKKAKVYNRDAVTFLFLLFICVVAATVLAEEISEYVKEGMMLAVGAILPSVFPFMILSELINSSVDFSNLGRLGEWFEKVFHMNRRLFGPFLIGTLAGFPIGAKMAAELYEGGEVTKDEAEAAVAVSSSPSLAFVISGVGAGMWKSTTIGICLYLSVVLSAVLYTAFTRRKKAAAVGVGTGIGLTFDFMRSVERATLSSLGIIGVISIFSVFSGLIRLLPYADSFAHFVLPLFEVGGATAYLSKCALKKPLALLLTAFALGFSGLSVHLQVRSAFAKTDLGYLGFFKAKVIIGLLSAVIFVMIFPFIK